MVKKYCHYDKRYLKSLLCFIKILQIVSLLIAWATVQSFIELVSFPNTKFSKLQLFVLVAVIAWLSCIVVFCINAVKLAKTLPIPWYWVYLVKGVVFSLFLFISMVFAVNMVQSMKDTERVYTPVKGYGQKVVRECEYISLTDSGTRCEVLHAGLVFGAISICLFIFEIVVTSHKLRRGDLSLYNTASSQVPDDITVSSMVDGMTPSRIPSNIPVQDMYSRTSGSQRYPIPEAYDSQKYLSQDIMDSQRLDHQGVTDSRRYPSQRGSNSGRYPQVIPDSQRFHPQDLSDTQKYPSQGIF